ncbi:hypothetical protein E2C01_075163 [Portunus trituberculatus]|uniref:Uncharacterized protein n=1 Tax=Portunus trituberculatus TaxID=210409 RepID=A0A5B7I7S7_PORTR|nr:hypothetical protein [Portunus trituberculatus]
MRRYIALLVEIHEFLTLFSTYLSTHLLLPLAPSYLLSLLPPQTTPAPLPSDGSAAACVCLSVTLGRLCDVRPSSRHHSDRAASRATFSLLLLSPYLPSLCLFVDGSHLRRRVSVSWEYIYTPWCSEEGGREAGREEEGAGVMGVCLCG